MTCWKPLKVCTESHIRWDIHTTPYNASTAWKFIGLRLTAGHQLRWLRSFMATLKTPVPKLLEKSQNLSGRHWENRVASQIGFEPTTCRLGGDRSIQLSYWDTDALDTRKIFTAIGTASHIAHEMTLCCPSYLSLPIWEPPKPPSAEPANPNRADLG